MKITPNSFSISKLLLGLGLCVTLQGCGSGGGGDDEDFGGAARLEFRVGPTTIDTGDRVRVEAKLSEIHDDGVLLKFSYPTSLSYVADSATLDIDDDETSIVPVANVEADNDMYLVFSLPQTLFDDELRGTVSVELQALKTTDRATVGVDADVDSTTTFNPQNPEYAAEDEVDVEVRK